MAGTWNRAEKLALWGVVVGVVVGVITVVVTIYANEIKCRVSASICGRTEFVLNSGQRCPVFRVFAQNRWMPYGATIRQKPDVTSMKLGEFNGNEIITVDGWTRSGTAYPTNPPPFNNDIWFHLSNQPGWVSFAAVREVPTPQDPTGADPDGGQQASTPLSCEGKAVG